MAAAASLKSTSPKLHSHFSIENILRKEEHSSKTCPSFSDVSEEQTLSDSWKREYFDIERRDYSTTTTTTTTRDEIPILENRNRLTEHWVYENHIQRQRHLPILRSNSFHTKRPSYSSEIDLIPSPSPTSTWSSPTEQIKRQTLEYWFLDRMMHNYSNNTNGYTTNTNRRSPPETVHPLRYYWNSSLPDEREAFPGLLPRSPRLKSNIDDDDSDEGNRKGGQVRFSHTQSTELERVFNLQKYVSPQERKQLARSIDLSERQVKTWFQNRRAKWRRIKLEDEMRARMTDNKNTTRHDSTTSSKHDENESMQSSDADFRLDFRVRDESRMC